MSKKAIVVGASAGVGLAIAEGLAAAGWDLVIGSRNQDDLDALVAPLVEAGAGSVTPIAVDVSDDNSLTHFIAQAATNPSAVIITAGSVSAIDEGTTDWATTSTLVTNNMTGVMKLAGHYAIEFETADAGTLVLFSSIAAGAPRRNNVAYAAAKAGLESFAGSMQHRLGRSGAAVHLYRLGYVDTRLAQGDLKLKPADPKKVAARVISGLGGRSRTVFEPRYWSPIVRGLQILPSQIYNRLDF
ncbi:MAG: short-subunit dehydrogenase [Candidatus Aldehydirespiratoraceae bacterium]|jgi:short-subunit dehydrogenase